MTEGEAVERIILSMCPEKVCRTCGEPSRRIVESVRPQPVRDGAYQAGRLRAGGAFPSGVHTEYTTTGWTDCGHNNWRPGVVLDPFLR